MGCKILVVDDEFEIVEFIKAILKTKGHTVLVAYDGEEGWNTLIREKPDLAIVDLRMPKVSGLELCRRVRRTPEIATMPLMVISSLGAVSDKPESFWAAGLRADDFLSKPFDPLTLLGRVEFLLRRRIYLSEANHAREVEASQAVEVPVERPPANWKSNPKEVVRVFVESWNRKDFATEYETLAEEMRGGATKEEYMARRLKAYTEMGGQRTEQRVLDVYEKISHMMAAVDCLREDRVGGQVIAKDERYMLRKTADGWKIVSVRSRPISKSSDL
ncbi:MAG: response regulator [Candidatus Sumerlaeaceae bacterium]|nr:response regulator [Candidatus Sumerlaeaceae bacterium]